MENKDLEYYKNLGVFDEEQLEEIRKGLSYNRVDVDVIADPALRPEEMGELIVLMINGADPKKVKDYIFYLRNERFSQEQLSIIYAGFMENVDVRYFANPLFSIQEMLNFRDISYGEKMNRLSKITMAKVFANKSIIEFNKENKTNLQLIDFDSINQIQKEDEFLDVLYLRDGNFSVLDAIEEKVIDEDEEWCKKYFDNNGNFYETVIDIYTDDEQENKITYFCNIDDNLAPINNYNLNELYKNYLENKKNKSFER